MAIINIISQILAYNDAVGTTDNPNQRIFDWSRKLYNLSLAKPKADQLVIMPGESVQLFNGMRFNPLNSTSILKLELISAGNSLYRLSVESGASGFRTLRNVDGINSVTVSVNNNATAIFTFTGASLDEVSIGDIMRIKGFASFDSEPYVFNALNSGLWSVIGKSDSSVTVCRLIGQSFSGVNETVTNAANDVKFYSVAGIQVGDKILIKGTFSSVTHRAYSIVDVTPTTIDFVSTLPLPNESDVPYVVDSIIFYTNLKKFIYLEVDQDAVVRFNNDNSDNNYVTPLIAGDASYPGFLHKIGETYACTVINKSINPLNLLYFVGE